MANIFISYSDVDKTLVHKLADLLVKKGWTVWWDRSIPYGQKFDNVIESELDHADCVIVVWTRKSVVSEWVKSEASEATRQKKIVPLILEKVELPLAFRRTQSARMIDWKGEEDHPALELLFRSIENCINQKQTGSTDENKQPLKKESTFVSNINNLKAFLSSHLAKPKLLTIAVIIAIVIFGFYYISTLNKEKNVVVRVFDWKKNPVPQGEVQIQLQDYIRKEFINKNGEALFAGIPGNVIKNNVKILVSSPGYTNRTFDTLLSESKPLELTLNLTTAISISGKIKTAGEMPIKDVEIDVEGTRYVTRSITDGSYNLKLGEYTLGDEIMITTSHQDYEDKTSAFRIDAPAMNNKDIFLNPVKK